MNSEAMVRTTNCTVETHLVWFVAVKRMGAASVGPDVRKCDFGRRTLLRTTEERKHGKVNCVKKPRLGVDYKKNRPKEEVSTLRQDQENMVQQVERSYENQGFFAAGVA